MIVEQQLLALVDEIYGAALDSRKWSRVIESFSRLFDGVGGALLRRDCNFADLGFIEYGGLDEAMRAAYERYYPAFPG
jgi:hypothetical protein